MSSSSTPSSSSSSPAPVPSSDSSSFGFSVDRQALKQALSCKLCHRLFVNAHTINECLHTFCYSCLETWFSQKDHQRCPYPDCLCTELKPSV